MGRPAAIRASVAVAVTGVLAFVVGPAPGWAVTGAVSWGAGAALGFPAAVSAGAADPARAAGRVGLITGLGYGAYLGGRRSSVCSAPT